MKLLKLIEGQIIEHDNPEELRITLVGEELLNLEDEIKNNYTNITAVGYVPSTPLERGSFRFRYRNTLVIVSSLT